MIIVILTLVVLLICFGMKLIKKYSYLIFIIAFGIKLPRLIKRKKITKNLGS